MFVRSISQHSKHDPVGFTYHRIQVRGLELQETAQVSKSIGMDALRIYLSSRIRAIHSQDSVLQYLRSQQEERRAVLAITSLLRISKDENILIQAWGAGQAQGQLVGRRVQQSHPFLSDLGYGSIGLPNVKQRVLSAGTGIQGELRTDPPFQGQDPAHRLVDTGTEGLVRLIPCLKKEDCVLNVAHLFLPRIAQGET